MASLVRKGSTLRFTCGDTIENYIVAGESPIAIPPKEGMPYTKGKAWRLTTIEATIRGHENINDGWILSDGFIEKLISQKGSGQPYLEILSF